MSIDPTYSITWARVSKTVDDKKQEGISITENGKKIVIWDTDGKDGITKTEIESQLAAYKKNGTNWQEMSDRTLSIFDKMQGKSVSDIEKELENENTSDGSVKSFLEEKRNREKELETTSLY